MLQFSSIETKQGLRLYGTLHKASSLKKPIVIIAHGYFSSNRVGPHRLYYQIAEALKNEGYNVIRFDLRGVGESEGSIENIKYCDHVNDLESVITTFRLRFNDAPVILIAHCIGCNVSISAIKKQPEIFRKAIFISPYFTTPLTLDAFFTKDQQEQLVQNGYTYRKGIYADSTFFSGINEFSKFSCEIKKHQNLITVISAAEDQFISQNEISCFYNEIESEPIIIPNADHNYLERGSRNVLIEKIVQLLREEM